MGAAIEGMLEEDKEYAFGPGECLQTFRHGILKPGGLTLRYPGLRPSEDGEGFSYMGGGGGKERVRVYGGALTENVVQSLARDVVAEQMTRITSEYGYRPALMTHDEIVCIVDAKEGGKALERMTEVMKVPPAWAIGLPLDAAGGIGRSYGDAK
jgi:DNA polymerase